MNDIIFILITLLIVSGLIYFVYNLILGSGTEKQDDLQITSTDLLQQLKILYKQKKYHIAECMAKKYLEKQSNNDEIRKVLTKSLFDNGKVYEAIEHAKIIIKHQPNNAEMKILLANFYTTTLKPIQAVTILKEVVKDDPSNATALKRLAEIYTNTNQKRSAIKLYEDLAELVQSNQEKANIKSLLANMHIEYYEFDLAIVEYTGILEIYPADAQVRKNLIQLYNQTSDWTLSIEMSNELLEMHTNDSNDLWCLKNLVKAYSQIKDFEKAMEHATLVKDHQLSNKVEAAQDIAKILMNTDEIDKSVDILAKLVEENPKDIELKKSLSAAYQAQKDFHSAANVYKKILDEVGAEEITQVHHEMSNLYADWGVHLFAEDDLQECFKKFTLALQYDSGNPEIYYRLGSINQSIKNYKEAISQYKKAIDMEPKKAEYYYSIAQCYKAIEDIFEEKKALDECAKYDPKNAKIFYELGVIAHEQRDINKAIEEMRKAILLDPNFIDAKYQLALMLEVKGGKEDAIDLYEDILKFKPDYKDAADNLKMLKG